MRVTVMNIMEVMVKLMVVAIPGKKKSPCSSLYLRALHSLVKRPARKICGRHPITPLYKYGQ